jgi:hypothetical protein
MPEIANKIPTMISNHPIIIYWSSHQLQTVTNGFTARKDFTPTQPPSEEIKRSQVTSYTRANQANLGFTNQNRGWHRLEQKQTFNAY